MQLSNLQQEVLQVLDSNYLEINLCNQYKVHVLVANIYCSISTDNLISARCSRSRSVWCHTHRCTQHVGSAHIFHLTILGHVDTKYQCFTTSSLVDHEAHHRNITPRYKPQLLHVCVLYTEYNPVSKCSMHKLTRSAFIQTLDSWQWTSTCHVQWHNCNYHNVMQKFKL